MLLGADWKHQVGHTAKFLLEEDDDSPNPMSRYTAKRGKQAGSRFMMVLLEIADDEEVVNRSMEEREEARQTPRQKGRVKTAGMWTREKMVAAYLLVYDESVKAGMEDSYYAAVAKAYVKKKLGIKSLRDLANNDAAWREFCSIMYRVQKWWDELSVDQREEILESCGLS